MKLACSSSAFHRSLASGAITQLEWIDSCAHELAADGIVVDVRHFPRTDGDYLAQVKKMAVDTGLAIAAVADDGFFGGASMEATFALAQTLGAPMIAAPLPQQTAATWSEALERLGEAATAAKRANVTIALRNAAGTFAAGTAELKAAAKETDSAWLRFGPEPAAFEAGSELAPLLAKTVLIWQPVDGKHEAAGAAILAQAQAFNGWLALDRADGEGSAQGFREAVRRWRRGLLERLG